MKPLRILLSSILLLMAIGCAKEQPAETPAATATTPAATVPATTAPATEGTEPTSTQAAPGEAEPLETTTAATSTPETAPGAAAKANPDPKLIASGKDLFRSKCASCHGAEGKGDTEVGRTRKLRDLASADVQGLSDEKLAEILHGGKGSLSAKAHESRALTEDQINALIAFIRSLG